MKLARFSGRAFPPLRGFPNFSRRLGALFSGRCFLLTTGSQATDRAFAGLEGRQRIGRLRTSASPRFAQQPGTPEPPGTPPQPPPDPTAPRPYEDPPRPIPIPRPEEPPVVDAPPQYVGICGHRLVPIWKKRSRCVGPIAARLSSRPVSTPDRIASIFGDCAVLSGLSGSGIDAEHRSNRRSWRAGSFAVSGRRLDERRQAAFVHR